jgi:hypothetical protein
MALEGGPRRAGPHVEQLDGLLSRPEGPAGQYAKRGTV